MAAAVEARTPCSDKPFHEDTKEQVGTGVNQGRQVEIV